MTPIIAESTLIGTIRMIASGSVQLSYCAARTRKTNSTESAKMKSAVLPVSFCCSASSVHSNDMPGGKAAVARPSIRSSAWPEEIPGAAFPCSGTDVYML